MKTRIIAGAACVLLAAVVVGLLVGSNLHLNKDSDFNSDGIRTFESYSQIEEVLAGIEEEQPILYMNGETGLAEANGMEAAVEDTATKSVSDTYVQVEGIDEADIIKTDGRYIYFVSSLGYDVLIDRVSEGAAEEVTILTEEETGIAAEYLYLSDDRLVIIGTESSGGGSIYETPQGIITAAGIYDVTDPADPQLIGRYRQSGGYIASRLSGGRLYLVTNDHLNLGKDRIVPSAGMDKNYAKLKPEEVSCFPEPYTRAYIVAGTVDIQKSKGSIASHTKALLGASEDIYCTDSRMYFMCSRIKETGEQTDIIRADLSKGSVDFAAAGSVRGHLLNQFAMDEKDGYLRVAATAFVKDKDVNYLYVLDDKLKTCGKVKGFAPGEEIKAVKYVGDTAYVITYEQTDPLFVIDLTDPEAPQIKGSAEITGFSSLLLPQGDGTLLGIGSATEEGEFGEVETGLKFALFDITDPLKPQVLDSREYTSLQSDVQYDHKALTVNREKGWYAVPYFSWEDGSGGVLQIEPEDGEIKERNHLRSEYGIARCVYIGDYIYGLPDETDQIISWEEK